MKNKLLITLLLLVSFLQAQEKKESYSFSLQQAIDHALQHNYSIINANRDIEAAKQKKWETTATGLPQISGSVGYLNNIDFTLQGVSGNAFNPAGNPDDISLFAFGTKQSMNSNLTLSQLLFDGSYIVALQASKTYLKYYENAKQKTNLEIREMVINAYGNVLLAEESVAILEKNKATLSKTLSDTQETFNNGLIEEENVEQLQITLSSINSNLSNVKRLLVIANKMLKFSLGIELSSELKLTDKLDALTASNLDLSLTQNSFEVSQNINYQMVSNLQEQRSLELKLQKSKALPSLGAAYNFGYNSFANEFDFANGDQKWNRFSNLGVSLNVPLLAISSTDTTIYEEDSFESMIVKAQKENFNFPYLFDADQSVAKIFNAQKTPQAFVIWKENNEWVIKYDGAIDDNGADPLLVTQKYVEDAVNILLKGTKVKIERTSSIGCQIKYRG